MGYYAGFYPKFTISDNIVTWYATNTPTSLALPQPDTSNYNYTLIIPSTLKGSLLVKTTALAIQSRTITLDRPSGTFIDGNTSYSEISTYTNCILFYSN